MPPLTLFAHLILLLSPYPVSCFYFTPPRILCKVISTQFNPITRPSTARSPPRCQEGLFCLPGADILFIRQIVVKNGYFYLF
jgi:hypothetical protein